MTRKIIAIVDDMFFASKIRATAEALGVEVSFPRTKDVVLEKLRTSPPDLIVADLQNQRFDVIEFGGALKADSDLRKIPMLGFFSHVEVEIQRKATTIGFDRVIPRSLFARDLASILKGD
jgi:CheY-like chemotaxis protein